MADFNQPTNSTTYSSVLSTINSKIASVAKMDFSADTNVPTGALRLNTTSGLLESYNGATWDVKGYLLASTLANKGTFTGDLTIASGTIQNSSGSAAAPSYSFSADTSNNTGMYRYAENSIGFTANGAAIATVDANGVTLLSGRVLNTAGSNSAPAFSFSGDNNTGIYNVGTDAIGFATNGTLRATLSSTGQLSVGIATAAGVLHVGAVAAQNDSILEQYSNDTAGPVLFFRKSRGTTEGSSTIVVNGDALGTIAFRGTNGSSHTTAASIRATVDGTPGAADMPGRLIFATTLDGTTTLTDRMVITNAGLVGINNTSPAGQLDVSTTMSSHVTLARFGADSTGGQLVIQKSRGASVGTNTIVQSGDAIGGIFFRGANGTGFSDAAAIVGGVNGTPGASNDMPGALFFYTTPDGSGTLAERVRIIQSGYAGFGGIQPLYPVHVSNTYNNTVAALMAESTVAGDVAVAALAVAKKDNNSTSSQEFVRFLINSSATSCGRIVANGANQAAFASTSDARLKENIVDLPSQLASIMALRPVEFDYKDGSGHQLGFLAQEVQAIYPDLVAEGLDGYLALSGLGRNEARLIKAFQEYAALNEARLAAIETALASLMN